MKTILFSLFIASHIALAAPVKIGTADAEIQIDKTGLKNLAADLKTSTYFDVITKSAFPYETHGTLSFMTIFLGLGPEFQLASIAQVGHYPVLEDLGEANRYRINGIDVFDKTDNGQLFHDTHTAAGAQVIYIGWPIGAGNAQIDLNHLKALYDRGVILVEVAPKDDPLRGFRIGEYDKYALQVGGVDELGRVMNSSRKEGVDVFCPGFVTLPGSRIFADTSAAAAVCTRYVAQMLAIKPTLNLEDIRKILTETGSPAIGGTAKIANLERALEYLRTH